ncbi:hypothetical protein [Photobacterium alginatilyticum]|uniref:Uncharacterized protein n=1 Tax=Photobacterium alginatilyticum TaxID=1775171 RepID=A0ABW9YHL0_9GAMM|nr:hypothetical protein [Photobacterium alginatilyticum]NBI53250.1 hypothetical protein [Photobacterium alginatilyticum]
MSHDKTPVNKMPDNDAAKAQTKRTETENIRDNRPKTYRLLMHFLTLAPIAHLFIGMPLFFVIFAGSISYFVGLCLYLLSLVLPVEFAESLALSYTVSGKLLVGSTLYHGWPIPLMSLFPVVYLACLLLLRYRFGSSNFAYWVSYDIETIWRVTLISFAVMAAGIVAGLGMKTAAICSTVVTTLYLLIRIYRFYAPLWGVYLRKLNA